MDHLAAVPVRLAVVLAIAVNPWLIVRHFLPRSRDGVSLLAASGATAVALCTAVAVALQGAGLPVTPASLAAAHWSLAAVLIIAAALRHLPIGCADPVRSFRVPLLLAAGFAIMVLPITHLAGIDTYKWQDLATSVRVEQRVAWLVHPLSLFGFTPRSYPSAQPLTLATIQMLGGLGVDWGYFGMSVLSGGTGVFAACLLGRRLFGTESGAACFAFLYAFSPVFVRYNHWATGRGLFVALLPLFLLGLLDLPKLRAWLLTAGMAMLLLLSHKAALVAVGLIPLSLALAPFLPRSDRRWVPAILVIPSVIAAVLISPTAGHAPAGAVLGFAGKCVTRFGWFVPAAGAALVFVPGWFSRPSWRRLVPAMLLTFPLAFHREMYGALIALPFVTWAATEAVLGLVRARPSLALIAHRTTIALTAAAAIAIVMHRSLNATSHAVWRAAQFLEAYDPAGPYRIDGAGRARSQVQAYVSGCPRFNVNTSEDARIAIKRPPSGLGPLRERFQAWSDYLRGWVAMTETDTDYYGRSPRVYTVIEGNGAPPAQARQIYAQEGVSIWEVRGR